MSINALVALAKLNELFYEMNTGFISVHSTYYKGREMPGIQLTEKAFKEVFDTYERDDIFLQTEYDGVIFNCVERREEQ